MSMQCRIVVRPSGPSQAYLTGALDENAMLDKVFTELASAPGDELAVILQGILRVNSIGVRDWVRGMAALTGSRRVLVEALSYPLAMQANQVSNLMGNATVISCMAPYYCRLCEANRIVLVTRAELEPSPLPPMKACGDCGSPMEFDEVDEYFAFLRRP